MFYKKTHTGSSRRRLRGYRRNNAFARRKALPRFLPQRVTDPAAAVPRRHAHALFRAPNRPSRVRAHRTGVVGINIYYYCCYTTPAELFIPPALRPRAIARYNNARVCVVYDNTRADVFTYTRSQGAVPRYGGGGGPLKNAKETLYILESR